MKVSLKDSLRYVGTALLSSAIIGAPLMPAVAASPKNDDEKNNTPKADGMDPDREMRSIRVMGSKGYLQRPTGIHEESMTTREEVTTATFETDKQIDPSVLFGNGGNNVENAIKTGALQQTGKVTAKITVTQKARSHNSDGGYVATAATVTRTDFWGRHFVGDTIVLSDRIYAQNDFGSELYGFSAMEGMYKQDTALQATLSGLNGVFSLYRNALGSYTDTFDAVHMRERLQMEQDRTKAAVLEAQAAWKDAGTPEVINNVSATSSSTGGSVYNSSTLSSENVFGDTTIGIDNTINDCDETNIINKPTTTVIIPDSGDNGKGKSGNGNGGKNGNNGNGGNPWTSVETQNTKNAPLVARTRDGRVIRLEMEGALLTSVGKNTDGTTAYVRKTWVKNTLG